MPQELIEYAGYDSLNTTISDSIAYNMVFEAYQKDNLLNVLHLINRVIKMNPFTSTE